MYDPDSNDAKRFVATGRAVLLAQAVWYRLAEGPGTETMIARSTGIRLGTVRRITKRMLVVGWLTVNHEDRLECTAAVPYTPIAQPFA